MQVFTFHGITFSHLSLYKYEAKYLYVFGVDENENGQSPIWSCIEIYTTPQHKIID